MALAACLDFRLPGCDFLEPPCFVNRHTDLAFTAAEDDTQRGVVATNLFAMRRMHAMLVLPNSVSEPYASVVRLLDETAHRAGVSETRRASHPCPVALHPHDAAPRWLTLSLRVLVSQLMLRMHMAADDGMIAKSEMWVLEHLVVFPQSPLPPVFRMPFDVSDLSNIVGHFYQPRPRPQWLQSAQFVSRPRAVLTQAESNWFYARLSAFAFYAYCTMLPPYAVWGALRLFFDRVETIVGQDRCIEIEAYKIRSANPVLYDAWSRWNEQMALYAHWFVALYQVMERSSTTNLAPVKALVNGVVVDTIQEPFRELRSFMRDAREYWPAMYSCQSEFSSLEPLLVPLQRVSRHEASALLQTRLCRRDIAAFLNTNMADEDPNCGSVCYRVPDMLPSHMRATLEHVGFEPEDIASVVMAPHFNGGGGGHTYDLFVRMHARHECAWQVASICNLPRAARPLFQRLACAPRECVVNRPSVLRTLQRAVLRLVNSKHTTTAAADEFTFLRGACGAADLSPALVFFCEAGLVSTCSENDTVRLRTPLGASDADMNRSVKQWSSALRTQTTATELLGALTRARFREIVRATAPLLDTVQHLRVFVMFACANPLLGDRALCADLQGATDAKWPHAVVSKDAPAFRLTESALGIVFDTQSAGQLGTMLRVLESLNALRDGVCALADPYTAVQQNIGWQQTDDDLRLLREREAHARTSGLRSRNPPAATRSLALYPDQCGLVCASMRNCANGDDLVAELLLGPDAKMNWQPTSSDPDYYRIAPPPAANASVRPAASQDTTADARTRAHFGGGGDRLPRMRLSYPEPVRATVHMTADEVKQAKQAQSIGQPVRVQHPAPAPAAKAKRTRPPEPAAAKTTVQFNSAGKILRPAAAKQPAAVRTPKPIDKLKCTASMLDFMDIELDKS